MGADARGDGGGSGPDLAAAAARIGGLDPGSVLLEIAASARTALGADRATCYAYDVGSQTVAAVHTTESDPARRALLERTVGLGPLELPIWRLQLIQPDPLLVVEDVAADDRVPPRLAGRLAAGAFVGVRLEHGSVRAPEGGNPMLGALFCSYGRPRRFSAADRTAVRGLASLGALALANAHLQVQTATSLERARALEAEQASLRRLATRVAAADADPGDVYACAAEEAARLLSVEAAIVVRFEGDQALVVGTHGGHSALGARLPLSGPGALAHVARAGVEHAVPDYAELPAGSPIRAHALASGFRTSAAAPVRVEGRLWGAILATGRREGAMPAGAEVRLGRFADLVALAIANADARSRLVEQASRDPLTGLANHRTFMERLEQEIGRAGRSGEPLGLVLIDLDHFKSVNDTHGHLAGDAVLVEFAARLRHLARVGDVVARVGGEEFAWLVPGCGPAQAMTVAQRARAVTSGRPFPVVGRLTMSAGVACHAPGVPARGLVQAADAALYAAKARGRDACVAAPERGG